MIIHLSSVQNASLIPLYLLTVIPLFDDDPKNIGYNLMACLHGVAGPQVGVVTRFGG